MSEGLYLKQLEVGPMENFVYLIGDLETRQALVVDPAWQVDTILNQARADGMEIVGALVSHHHHDHTNGLEELLEAKEIPIYVHQADAEFVDLPPSQIQKSENGQEIAIGKIAVKMLHTPGHTPGSQCFHVRGHLVSGDTLFIQGCGRCDLPGGDPEQMYYSLTQKLMRMDDSTVLLPGHNYAEKPQSTLGEEKTSNPYLKTAAASLKDFLMLRMRRRS